MKPEHVLLTLAVGLGAALLLGAITNNPKTNPNVRWIARTTEGDIVQDLVTGAFRFV
jgi:hypothetical protein